MVDNQNHAATLNAPDMPVIMSALGFAPLRRYESTQNAQAHSMGQLRGVFDTVRDIVGVISVVSDVRLTKEGTPYLRPQDQRNSTRIENWFLDRTADAAGGVDVRMSGDWTVNYTLDANGNSNVKVNGERRGFAHLASFDGGDADVPENGSHSIHIKDPFAVFLYDRNSGELEILTAEDPSGRWGVLARSYLETNAGLMVASLAAGGVTTAGRVTTIAGRGIAVAEALENTGTIADISDVVMGKVFFEPGAVAYLARIFADPSAVDERVLARELNVLFADYTHRDGPMAPQNYVPSLLPDGSGVVFGNQDINVWGRMQQAVTGVVDVYSRPHPFVDISEDTPIKGMPIDKFSKQLRDSPYFRLGLGQLTQAFEAGETLSLNELRILSLGIMAEDIMVIDPAAEVPFSLNSPDPAKIREFLDYARANPSSGEPSFFSDVAGQITRAEQELAELAFDVSPEEAMSEFASIKPTGGLRPRY